MYLSFLVSQTADFCWACMMDRNHTECRPLLRLWHNCGGHQEDYYLPLKVTTRRLICFSVERCLHELQIMEEKNLEPMKEDCSRAFRFATVAYCGLIVQGGLESTSTKQHQKLSVLLIIISGSACKDSSATSNDQFYKIRIPDHIHFKANSFLVPNCTCRKAYNT
jgi:hypothetical protein